MFVDDVNKAYDVFRNILGDPYEKNCVQKKDIMNYAIDLFIYT